MQIENLNSPNDRAIYLDDDESNNENGNVITELNYHCMVSFVDYEQLLVECWQPVRQEYEAAGRAI